MTLFGPRAGGQSVESLRLEFCNVQNRDKGIDIKTISIPELMVIAFTVTRLCGSAALHIATGSQMRMAVDCFRGTIFNWCDAMLANVKGQVNQGKKRTAKDLWLWGYSCEFWPGEGSDADPTTAYCWSWASSRAQTDAMGCSYGSSS